jgi:branched-chain amino acid transport system substrate-binding protein
VDLIVADDQSDPTAAVNSARRLATLEKVHVVIGPNISQFALASAPVFNESKTASIAVSGSTALTPQTANYLFSYAPPGDVAARAMVAYAQDTLKAKSIAYIGDNGAQAKIAAEAIKVEAAKRKLTVIATQEYEFRATDITPQMLTLRRANPDVLLMWPGVGEDHGLIVKTASDLNWKVRIVNGQATPLHIAAGKKVFADAFKDVASPLPKSWTYCPNEAVGSGALPKFADRLKAAEGENYARLSPL